MKGKIVVENGDVFAIVLNMVHVFPSPLLSHHYSLNFILSLSLCIWICQ
jgi:hypothetical protein